MNTKQAVMLIIALAFLVSPLIFLLVPGREQAEFSTIGELRNNFSLFIGKEVRIEGMIRSIYLETSELTVYVVDDNTGSISCAGGGNLPFIQGDEITVVGVLKNELPSWAPTQQYLFIDIQEIRKAV